ncbi:MAG TPA: sigma-70 family RNA polymerase sigma factor [Tepidisphaeraceae bacterium]|jgi:RNA polymerase sigma-70 factor (ECF subfamily)
MGHTQVHVGLPRTQFRDLAMAELPAVYRMAYHLTRGGRTAAADPDDLVQEAYLRAFTAEHSFRLGEAGVRPWLLKIVYNCFLTRIKRAKIEPIASELAGDLAERSDHDAELTGQALADLDWEQMDDRLKRAIHDLPETYRTVFLLSSIEGLKYREIADVLEMPMGTVMSRLFRARTMLLDALTDLGAELRISGKRDESGREGD